MSDEEFYSDSDQDEVSENHSKLLDAVRSLDKGQRIRKLEQYEPSLEVSEFSTSKTATETLNQDEVGIDANKIKSKLKQAPLERPAAERIKRSVGFENTKKELGKWTGIIARNRTAACMSFPLSQTSMKLEGTDEYVKRFRLQSELERKLAELDEKKEPEEEKDEFPMTLQEILEQRHEAAKFRAQQSYKAAKATRQKKIKSKKYHRIQRKERIKQALKEFEELQKTDPQAALEKLEELDKTRAEERMTLRHKSTGQWAKSKLVRAKYDKESRQVLAQQLAISRDLTQKVKKDDESEDDDDNDQPIHFSSTDKENPWINGAKSDSEVNQFISSYRKFWDEKNKSESKNSKDETKKDVDTKKIFDEPAIQDIPQHSNPVEEVTEEYPDDHEDKNKQKKKLQKSSKDKLGIKSTKSKITKVKKSKIKAGTSSWSISPVESMVENSNDIDIDEMFNTIDDKLQDKINKKLAKVKLMLEKETKNEEKRKRKNKNKNKQNETTDDIENLSLRGQKSVKPVIDKPIEESTGSKPSDENSVTEIKATNITDFNRQVTSKSSKTEIDPNKFINMKPKHVKTLIPDDIGGEDEVMDDNEVEEDQHQIISEAFADDDVVDEFRKDKEEEIKKSQPEDLDLRLPGWGSWGGKNVKQSNRKKSRFIIKFPKEAPRRDENKGDVVIIEEKTPKIKKHLVNELPFPFTNVKDYEASIRAPIGRDFVPEKTFSKLIQPAIKTKMGKIIEPMSEDVLVKTENLNKRKKKDNEDKNSTNKKKKGGNVHKKGQKNVKKSKRT